MTTVGKKQISFSFNSVNENFASERQLNYCAANYQNMCFKIIIIIII